MQIDNADNIEADVFSTATSYEMHTHKKKMRNAFTQTHRHELHMHKLPTKYEMQQEEASQQRNEMHRTEEWNIFYFFFQKKWFDWIVEAYFNALLSTSTRKKGQTV